MRAKPLRGVVVGASTLLGKELAEEIGAAAPVWELQLAEADEAAGQIAVAGDEAVLIQSLRPDMFEHVDVAFFAETAATTRAHWQEARKAGASVLDLTAALEDQPGVLVRSPWVAGGPEPDLTTAAVVPAHPAAVMLGVVATRLWNSFGQVRLAATVLEPASQQGSRGLDEMHQQTVNLLGFHSIPQEVYDAQVAFNLLVSVGESAKLDLSRIAATIRTHLVAIAGESIASSLAIQLVQAPVFHGYAMSVFVELPKDADPAAVRQSLKGDFVQVLERNAESPSNQSVTERPEIQMVLSSEPGGRARAYWLWIVADNLRLTARHALDCAVELAALRGAPICSAAIDS